MCFVVPVFVFCVLFAAPQAAAQMWFTPQGREATGRGLLPYSSAGEALAGDVAKSPYIQPLGGTWKMKDVACRDQVAMAMATDEGWQQVQVSQVWAVNGKVVLLARSFKRPFVWDDREIFVRLQGVGAPYEVYVNGKKIGYNPSPMVGADFDVTRATTEGNNALVVVLYNDFPAAAALAAEPQMIVESEAYVFSQPKARLRDVDVATSFSTDGGGLLDLGVIIKSHLLNPREIEVFYELQDAAGVTLASGHRTAEFRMKQEDTVRFFANIPAIKPWSAQHPDLYTLQLKTQFEGRFGEYVAVPVGFREVRWERPQRDNPDLGAHRMQAQGGANGKLLVNGAETPLVATVVNPFRELAWAETRLKEFKKQGIDMIKLTGPASSAFYSLCDRVGIYVCDQAQLSAKVMGAINSANDPYLWPLFEDRIMTMYNASKGHPSTLMFSPAEGTANGFNLYRAYLILRQAESTRPVSLAGAGDEWNSDTSADGTLGRLIFRAQ